MIIALPRAAAVDAANYPVTDTTDAAQAPGFPGQCVSTQPGGTCTLRAALQAAQQIAGPHQINVQTSGVYALSLGSLTIDNVTLTITNTSGGSVAVDGKNAVRVLDIGATTAAQVTLQGVTIQGGNPSPGCSGYGGGLRIAPGSTATL